jgi:hypothetical protein
VEGGVALKSPDVGRKQAEANRTAAVAVVDEVDERRQLLAAVIVGCEQVRLMLPAGTTSSCTTPTLSGLYRGTRRPELLEAGEQKAGIARFVKSVSFHQPPRSPIHERCTPNRRQ